MSRNLGDAFVRVRPDTTGFEGETHRGLSSGLKKVAGVVAGALASREVLRGAKALTDRASDLSETGNKISVVFGSADRSVQRFARSAVKNIGQTQQSALDAAATFGTFGKAAGLNDKENAKFSRSLVKLTSDMASFSNTTPEEAIEAVGAALRGEAEPIRKYGVLLDDMTMRQRAVKLGLIDSVKTALTPANKVLAAQAEIMEQTKLAQGDFARTSGGFANQQRILAAQTETLKTKIGSGLLPVFSKGATLLTSQVMPPLISLASKWVPRASKEMQAWMDNADLEPYLAAIRRGLKDIDWGEASAGVGGISDSLKGVDWSKASTSLRDIAQSGKDLAPVAKDLATQLPGINDLLTVTGEVMGFAADHVDTLGKLMPWLVGGFAAYKLAQLGANAAQTLSLPLKIADIVATRAQTKALREFARTQSITAASTTIANTATATGTKLTMRQRVATLASTAASKVSAVVTKGLTLAQKGLNLVMRMNPIGLIITALIALGAGLVVAYKKSETFRAIVDKAWAGVKKAISVAWNNVILPILKLLKWWYVDVLFGAVKKFWGLMKDAWDGMKTLVQRAVLWIVDKFLWFAEKIVGSADRAFGWIPGLGKKLDRAKAEIAKFREGVNREMDRIRDEEVKITVNSRALSGDVSGMFRGKYGDMGGAGRLPVRAGAAAAAGGMGGGGLLPKVSASLAPVRKIATDVQGNVADVAAAISERLSRQATTYARRQMAGMGAAGPAGRVLPGGSYRIGMPYMGYPGHYGADYPAATGTPVYSPWAGRITASYDLPGSNPYNGTPYRSYGRVVKIAHNNGLSTLYAHLSSRIGRTGPIGAGAMIGRVGMNGNATGSHLHFEVSRGGSPFNPAGLGVFDRGGRATGIGYMPKRILKPERVLSPRQTESFDRLVDLLEHGGRGRGGRVALTITNWQTGRGYFEELAGDVVADTAELAGTRGRMVRSE